MFYFTSIVSSPLGAGLLVGLLVMIYLTLMTYNIYLPTIVILSVVMAFIVYQSQQQCTVRSAPMTIPATVPITTPTNT